MNKEELNITLQSKKEYIEQFINLTLYNFIDGFKSIYENVKKNNNVPKLILKEFQNQLKLIPQWSQHIIDTEYKRIKLSSKSEYLDNLIQAMFASYSQILLADSKTYDNLNIFIPTSSHVIHSCYISIARSIWKKPDILYHRNNKNIINNNLTLLNKIVTNDINSTIRNLLPFKEILENYLDNTLDNTLENNIRNVDINSVEEIDDDDREGLVEDGSEVDDKEIEEVEEDDREGLVEDGSEVDDKEVEEVEEVDRGGLVEDDDSGGLVEDGSEVDDKEVEDKEVDDKEVEDKEVEDKEVDDKEVEDDDREGLVEDGSEVEDKEVDDDDCGGLVEDGSEVEDKEVEDKEVENDYYERENNEHGSVKEIVLLEKKKNKKKKTHKK